MWICMYICIHTHTHIYIVCIYTYTCSCSSVFLEEKVYILIKHRLYGVKVILHQKMIFSTFIFHINSHSNIRPSCHIFENILKCIWMKSLVNFQNLFLELLHALWNTLHSSRDVHLCHILPVGEWTNTGWSQSWPTQQIQGTQDKEPDSEGNKHPFSLPWFYHFLRTPFPLTWRQLFTIAKLRGKETKDIFKANKLMFLTQLDKT